MADFKFKIFTLILGLSINLVLIEALPYGGVKGVYQSPKKNLVAEDEATIEGGTHETTPEEDVFDIPPLPPTDKVSPPYPADYPDIPDSGSVDPDNTGPDDAIKDPDWVELPEGDDYHDNDQDWVEPPGGDDYHDNDQDWVEPLGGDDYHDNDQDWVEPLAGDDYHDNDQDWVEPPGGDDYHDNDQDWVEPPGGDDYHDNDQDWVEPPLVDDKYGNDQDRVEPPGGDNYDNDQDWIDHDDPSDMGYETEDPDRVEPYSREDNHDDGYDQGTTNQDYNDLKDQKDYGHGDGTNQVSNSEEDESASWYTKLSDKWSDLKDTAKDVYTSVGKAFNSIDTSGVEQDFYKLWTHFKDLFASLGVKVERGAACVFQKISRTFDENNSYQILTKLEELMRDGDETVKQFFETVGQKATSWVQHHNQEGVDEEEFFEDQIGDSDFNDEIFQDQGVLSQLDKMVTDGILSEDEVSQLTQSSSKIPLEEHTVPDSKENEIDSTGYGSIETTDEDFGIQSTGYGSSENTAQDSGKAISFLPHREDFKGHQYQPKGPISTDQEYQSQSQGQY